MSRAGNGMQGSSHGNSHGISQGELAAAPSWPEMGTSGDIEGTSVDIRGHRGTSRDIRGHQRPHKPRRNTWDNPVLPPASQIFPSRFSQFHTWKSWKGVPGCDSLTPSCRRRCHLPSALGTQLPAPRDATPVARRRHGGNGTEPGAATNVPSLPPPVSPPVPPCPLGPPPCPLLSPPPPHAEVPAGPPPAPGSRPRWLPDKFGSPRPVSPSRAAGGTSATLWRVPCPLSGRGPLGNSPGWVFPGSAR